MHAYMYRPFNAFSMHMQSCKALIYSHIQNVYMFGHCSVVKMQKKFNHCLFHVKMKTYDMKDSL